MAESSSFGQARREARCDVSGKLSWFPIVTMLQLALDSMFALDVPRFGHYYAAPDYIDGWAAVVQPDDWTRARTHKIVPSGRSGKNRILDVKVQETLLVSKLSQRQRRSFPERSKGRQSGFEKRRQSLCAMQPHGSADFSSLFCAGLTPEGTILWGRALKAVPMN